MTESFTYNSMGIYYPYLTVQNENFYERLYLPQEIKIDHEITFMDIQFSNVSVLLPPGEVVVTVTISHTHPSVRCVFDMGDKLDTANREISKNISADDPIRFYFQYQAFGRHNAFVYCVNLLDNVTKSETITVTNKCFSYGGEIAGIFAWQFFKPTNPMIASTADEIDLSNRMSVECFRNNPRFDWKIDNKTVSTIDNKGTFRFNRGSVEPGDHKVTLNVTLDNTWCVEHMYIRFIRPSPFAWIQEGSERNATRGLISIDAVTESYSIEHGQGHSEGLSFVFHCYRSAYSSFSTIRDEFADIMKNTSLELLTSANITHKECGEGAFKTTPGGLATLDTDLLSSSTGFLIAVEVSQSNTTPSYFFQAIGISPNDRPEIRIKCVVNCKDKLALQSPLKVKAECDSGCDDMETVVYQWNLYKIGSDGSHEELDLSQNQTKKGIEPHIFVVNEGVFEEGMTYLLELTVISDIRPSPGKDTLFMTTNLLPYNGSCSVSPTSGVGITTTFKVTCSEWKDEGQRGNRDYVEDAKQPIKYEYIQEVPRLINGRTEIIQSELFFGSENSATQLRLQVGDEAFDYNVTVLVKVKDMYGDVTENREVQLQVYRNQSFVPNDESDITSLHALFDTFDSIFYPLEGGGNKMALVQFVGSMTSILSSINVSTNGTSKLGQEMMTKNFQLMRTLRGAVSLESSEALNSVDTNNVMQKAKACLENLNIVNDSALDIGVETSLHLLNNLANLPLMRPFPVENWQSILDGTEGAFDIVDKALGELVPDKLSVVEPITYERFAQEYDLLYPINGTLTSEEEAERQGEIMKAYDEHLSLQRDANTRVASGQVNTTAYNMMEALRKALDIIGNTVLFGEPENVIERNNVVMTLEKTTLQNLANQTHNKTAFRLDLTNITNNLNTSEELHVQTAVFHKIPQYHGKGAGQLTSKGILVDIKYPNSSRANISMDIEIPNQGAAYSQRYQPFYSTEDPEQLLYFTFNMQSENDAILFYIRPDDFNPFDYTSFSLYDVYLQLSNLPTTAAFDWTYSMTIRDWVNEDYGFKIFVPQNTLGTGKAYLALKPIDAPSVPETSNRMRRRRSADVNQTSTNHTSVSNSSVFESADANFTMIIVTTGCRTWDESKQTWTSTTCSVLPYSTLNETFCSCPGAVGNIFATTFANSINFQTVWSKFDASNAAVYGTLIGILVLFVITCVWVRRKDKQDLKRWKTLFLCDSDSSDKYFYLLTVHTAMTRGSGTTSNVNFVVGSEDKDSGVRVLSNGDKIGFPTSSVRTFVMGTFESLGNPQYLRIWHDNSGKGNNASWNLHKVTIDDLHINKRYVFLCESWLSTEHEDGQTIRTIPVCTNEKLSEFNVLFPEYLRHGMTEDHLWFSAFMRPERSSFTRVQRVSCILMLLILTMLTNAMFFKSESEEANQAANISVGMMKFSLSTVYISIFGILITTGPVIFVTLLFTYSKQRGQKQKRTKNKYTAQDGMICFDDQLLYSMDHLPLPFFVRYIAWAIITLAVVASSFFLLLYSMEWGPDKSEEWLMSFFFSSTTSFVFVDPMKVLLFAMVPIVICRKPFRTKAPRMNLDKVREVAMTMHGNNIRDLISFRSSVLSDDTVIDTDAIRRIRLQHENERKALQTFLEIIFYIIFSYVVFSISYIDRDVRSYQYKTHILNVMDPPKTGFRQIRDAEDFVTWLNGTFYQYYFPENYYNAEPMGQLDMFYINDLVNTKIGPPRLRLVRMSRGKCRRLVENRDCVPGYDIYKEDDQSYCVGWNDNTSITCNSPYLYSMDAWRYQRSEDIWGTPITGEYETYGGGGFILKLENGLDSSRNIIKELMRYQWINRETRAVFLEFTLYNANTNLFVYTVFLAEFTENGGLLTWIDIYPFRPYQHAGSLGVYAVICYIIYLIAMVFGTVKLIMKLREDGCKCLRVSWNLVDVSCVVMSCVAVTVWVMRYIFTKQAMDLYYHDKTAFINFNHVVIWDMIFNITSSILVFISNIRLLRLLGYNKKMSELANVITNAATDLFGFGVIFSIAFLAWAMFGFLVFGSQMNDYRSVFTALGSLCNSLIGKNKLDIMVQASPTLAKIFYFTYVLFVMMILMTIFAVILNQSIANVRNDTASKPETFGIIDLLTNSLYAILGISRKKPDQTCSKNTFNSWYPGSSNPHLDTANIVRTMRDIFGDDWLDQKEVPTESKEPQDININASPLLEDRPQDNAWFREFMPELFRIPVTATAEMKQKSEHDKRMFLSYT